MPTQHDGFIKLGLVRPFVQSARMAGIDVIKSLKVYGLTESDVGDPNKAVHAEIIYGLTNHLAAAAENPYLGFSAAHSFDVQKWPPAQAARKHANTLGDFYIRLLMSVPQNASSVRHTLTVQADHAVYAVIRTVHTSQKPIQVECFGIGLQIRLLQTLLGSHWRSDAVSLETAFSETLPTKPIGVTVIQSDVPGLKLRFPASWLTIPLNTNAPEQTEAQTVATPEMSIVDALRGASRQLLSDLNHPADVYAKALGLSENRMKRALRLQGTTLPREIKRLRVDVAKEKLTSTKLSVAQIGALLGYEDQSHFARFFKSQAGISPSQFRAETQLS